MAKAKFALLSKDQAMDLASSIVKTGHKLDADIQSLAVTAIAYSNIHGDITIANRAIDAIRTIRGTRKDTFVAMLEKLGQLEYDTAKKTFSYKRKPDIIEAVKKDTYVMDFLESMTLAENHWTAFKKDPEPKSMYDMQDELKKFIKRMEKLAEQKDATVHNPEVLAKLKAMV